MNKNLFSSKNSRILKSFSASSMKLWIYWFFGQSFGKCKLSISTFKGSLKGLLCGFCYSKSSNHGRDYNTGVGGSSWQATLNGHSWHLSVSFRKGFVNKIYEHMHHWCPQDMTIKRIPITSFGSYGRTCVRSMKTENNLLRASVCSFKMFLSRHHTLGL